MHSCPYQRYYFQQAGLGGDSIPVFHGAEYQSGHGLGSIFGSLFRSALPLLKRGAAYLGKQVLKTGADVFQDAVFNHRDVKDATRDRLRQTGHRILDDVTDKILTGRGYRRAIKRKRKPKRPVQKKKRKKAKDIFD
jgi:hypothetical protein